MNEAPASPAPRLYLDRSPGEARGVLVLGGRARRLLIVRDGDSTPRLGARYLGRVAAVSPRMGLARIDLGEGGLATLKLAPDVLSRAVLAEGAGLEVEVRAEPARGKGASLTLIRPVAGVRPGLVSPGPALGEQLAALAPDADIEEGDEARDVADEAEIEALAREHRLTGGLTLTIEPTRALVAIDVDLDAAGSSRSALRANLRAIPQAARLVGLKALSGLVVIDLVGFPKEKAKIQAAVRGAFADQAGTVSAPVSRFGAVEISCPRRAQPIHEWLLDPDGRSSARTAAQRLVRALERQGRFDPGARLRAVCAPEVAEALRPLATRLGPRFDVRAELGRGRDDADITSP